MQFINDAVLRLYCWMKSQDGQTMAEYGLILALVSVVAIAALVGLRGSITGVFGDIADCLGDPAGCA